MLEAVRSGPHVLMTCRKYEDDHKCSSRIWFHTTTSEKADKTVSSTEALLMLEDSEAMSQIIRQAEGESGGLAKAFLADVTTSAFRQQFRCFFWGDVCVLSGCTLLCVCDLLLVAMLGFDALT